MPDLRMPELNEVTIAGRLTRDPHVGNNVTHLSLASNRYYKDQSGERQEQVTYTDVSAFGKTAEFAQRLKKGAAVIIDGSLSSYLKDGRNVLTVNAQRILPLEWDNTRTGQENAPHGNTGAQAVASEPPIDDDIPF